MSKNADGWIRHRGGKCPVEIGDIIDVRHRSGEVISCVEMEGSGWYWDHHGSSFDIMAYRLHKPAEQVDDNADLKAAAYDAIQPIQWRDRITEIDATTQALTTERENLVQKLASEGFALIGRINDLLTDAAQKHEDMSDPKNWRNGDIVECIVDHEDYFTAGYRYVVDYMECDWVNIHADDEGDENAIRPHKVKFHSRPSA